MRQNRFVRNYNCNWLCELCVGCRHRTFCNAYNFNSNAEWLLTLTTHARYLATHLPHQLSPWCTIRSWSIMRWLWDLLHLLWLGFVKDLLGSEILLMAMDLFKAHPGTCLKDHLHTLWREFKASKYTAAVPPFTTVLLQRSSERDYPVLHSYIKGATCKCIFKWAVQRTTQEAEKPDATEFMKFRATALYALNRFVKVCDGAGLFLTPVEAQEASDFGWLYLRTYQALAGKCLSAGQCLFKVRPKTHYFAHLLIHVKCTRENPRRHELMTAEDYMGKVKLLGRVAHRLTCGTTIMKRLCVFWSHRWYRCEHPWESMSNAE